MVLRLIIVVSLLALASGDLRAQATRPATQPATQPSGALRVLVLPFAANEGAPDWIGRAVQQSVSADLARLNSPVIDAVSDPGVAASTADALSAARRVDAAYVVFGNYQFIEPGLRITGQIIDVNTGKSVAGLKTTGSVRELFEMQDTLAFQARWGLGAEQLAKKPPVVATPAAPPPVIVPQGPVTVAGDRYANSELARAAGGDESMLDRYDAAGESFRRRIYEDTYLPFYPVARYNYGTGSHGYGYGYPTWGWGWGWTGQSVVIRNSCPPVTHTPLPVRVPFRPGLSVGGSYNDGNTQANFNFNTFPTRNYNTLPRNYNAPQSANYATHPRNYNTAPSSNYNSAPRNYNSGSGNAVSAPRNSVNAPRSSASAPRNSVSTPRNTVTPPANTVTQPRGTVSPPQGR